MADLDNLLDKHDVTTAGDLRVEVHGEAERLCLQLAKAIQNKKRLREKYEDKKKTVQEEPKSAEML